MDTKVKATVVPQSDSSNTGPEKAPMFRVQTSLRAGIVRPEEAFVYQNWDTVSAGITQFFDKVDARFFENI